MNLTVTIIFLQRHLGNNQDYLTNFDDVLVSLELISSVYILIESQSDEENKVLLDKMTKMITPSFINVHRILFHSTHIGKVAIVRQLNPLVHVDSTAETCISLAPFIRSVVQCCFSDTIPQKVGSTIKEYKDILSLDLSDKKCAAD